MYIENLNIGNLFAVQVFPKCKFTESIEDKNSIIIQCPSCGDGKPLVKRVAKKTGQTFYGCSRWPNCNSIVSEEKYKELINPKGELFRK